MTSKRASKCSWLLQMTNGFAHGKCSWLLMDNFALITTMESISRFAKICMDWGDRNLQYPEKILRKIEHLFWKKRQKCCEFRWDSSRKTSKESDNFTHSKFKTRRSTRKICNKCHQFPKTIGKFTSYKIQAYKASVGAISVISRRKQMLLLQPCYSHVNHRKN